MYNNVIIEKNTGYPLCLSSSKGAAVIMIDPDLEENVYGAIEEVIDPDIGIDIVNLGLIYGVDMDDNGKLIVTMTLTAMGCPHGGTLTEGVKRAVSEIPEVKECEVNIVWSPPWGKDKMSRYAKIALGVPDN